MKDIKIEQMLYGYRNGHTLLASSIHGKLKKQSVTDVLSDAAGSGFFTPYLTGYPLVEDGYYALSMTWYADEMPRPGCVWTHILLFPIDFMADFPVGLLGAELFQRPQGEFEFDLYRNSIEVTEYNSIKSGHGGYDKIHYDYFLYTLFSSNKNIYVCDKSGANYVSPIMDVVLKLPSELKRDFTVCTGSRTNRYFRNNIFSYQIAADSVAKSISKKVKDSMVYKGADKSEGFPIWTEYLSDLFISGRQKEIFSFGEYYSVSHREEIRELSRILYMVDGFSMKQDFGRFLSFFDKIPNGQRYKALTVDDVVYEGASDFGDNFLEDTVLDFFLKDVIKGRRKVEHKKKRILKEEKKENYASLLYNADDTKKINELFSSYIHNKLDANGARVVEELLSLIKPSDLRRLFNMDRSICSVLIRKKPALAVSRDIWKMDRNYQMEMLGSIPKNQLKTGFAEDLAGVIVDTTCENIAGFAETVIGEPFRSVIFNKIKSYIDSGACGTKDSGLLLEDWLPVMVKDRTLYIELLGLDFGWEIMEALMKVIDPYGVSDDTEYRLWGDKIRHHRSRLIEKTDYQTVKFCLPFITYDTNAFDGEMKDWVFNVLNPMLERDDLLYEEWNAIAQKLPEVSDERSWDKCLRLRLAFGRE